MTPRPVVRIRVPGTRQHLFFFRKMVVKPETFIEAGTIVDVVDRTGATVGCGFYNPKSEITLRMLGTPESYFRFEAQIMEHIQKAGL